MGEVFERMQILLAPVGLSDGKVRKGANRSVGRLIVRKEGMVLLAVWRELVSAGESLLAGKCAGKLAYKREVRATSWPWKPNGSSNLRPLPLREGAGNSSSWSREPRLCKQASRV